MLKIIEELLDFIWHILYKYADLYVDKLRKITDSILKDHFKIKSEFALLCLAKLFIGCIIAGLVYLDNWFTYYLAFGLTIWMGLFFAYIFRNAIILFSSMLILFTVILNFTGYYNQIIDMFKITEMKVDIVDRTSLELFFFILVIIQNISTKIKKQPEKLDWYYIDGFIFTIIALCTLQYLKEKNLYNISYCISIIINIYLLLYTAKTQLFKIEPNFKNENSIFLLAREIRFLSYHKSFTVLYYNILDIITNDFYSLIKITPAIFLYSSFLTYETWTSYGLNKFFPENSLTLELFKYVFFIG